MHQHLYHTNMHSAEFIHNELVKTKFRINFLESYKAGNKAEMEHHWVTESHIHVKVRNNFNQLNFSEFLTYGYAIDSDRILVALTITLGFCAGLTILGYFALKTREIAK